MLAGTPRTAAAFAERVGRDLCAHHLESVEETSQVGQLGRMADRDINSAHSNIELHAGATVNGWTTRAKVVGDGGIEGRKELAVARTGTPPGRGTLEGALSHSPWSALLTA